jgi:SHS2 domain-containing protein
MLRMIIVIDDTFIPAPDISGYCWGQYADGILLVMNDRPPAGFCELDHTADVELYVWGPDLPSLLEQAARGMFLLAGIHLKPGSRQTHQLELPVTDPESLLVNFLSELLFLGEVENLGFDNFDINIEGNTLHAELRGELLESQTKHIKAVTYHNLEVRKCPDGLEAKVVFDV